VFSSLPTPGQAARPPARDTFREEEFLEGKSQVDNTQLCACQPYIPANGEYRPDTFLVGSREFDPAKVGLKSDGYNGFPFDTSHRGNSNAGHTYGTGLDKEKRLDLLEYLKSL
jgi:hypothetical protein